MSIINNFIKKILILEGYDIKRRRLTPKNRSAYELSGKINCLIVLHYRSAKPYRWGVTANIISELKRQNKPWCVVLFFESHNSGYLLSSEDVLHYIDKGIWPLAKDGDFKPAPGSYLARNLPFYSVDELLINLSRVTDV